MDKYFSAALLLVLGQLPAGADAASQNATDEQTLAAIVAYRAANPEAHQSQGPSKRTPDGRKTRVSLSRAARVRIDRPGLLPPNRSPAD